ncbi:MAG: glutamate--tRNA ligase family protein [Clostridia bacterium]
MTDYEKIAELLYPNIKKTVNDYINMYPARKLPDGAEVTRLAPSPTGYLHIGQLFQCLVNKRIADQSKGVFYVRLEDTDQKREVAGAGPIMAEMINYFAPYTEGFHDYNKQNGDYGSYIQSERQAIYLCFAKDLVSRGLAYPCFCSSDDDDDESCDYREEQKKLGVPTGYYGKWAKCRNLTYEEVKANIDAGKKYTIRIKANGNGTEKMVHKDLLRGSIVFPKNFVDYVLIKSTGLALYHMAHVVDDTLMHTSTVIRGEEWLSSVPLHYQLFEYFGLKAPKYLHTNLLMTTDANTGNTRKISKRYDPWADCRWFIEQGFPKEAIIEYVLNLANSAFEPWRTANPNADINEYILKTGNMGKSGAMFDMVKLVDVSKNVIAKMKAPEIYSRVLLWAKKYDITLAYLLERDKEYAISIFAMDRDNKPRPRKDTAKWSEIKEFYSYMWDDLYLSKERNYDFEEETKLKDIKELLERYILVYSASDDNQTWFNKVKETASLCGYCTDMKEYKLNPEKYKGSIRTASTIIRVAITGIRETPDLCEIMKILGEKVVHARIVETILAIEEFIKNGIE